jgi:hypothetical protein
MWGGADARAGRIREKLEAVQIIRLRARQVNKYL